MDRHGDAAWRAVEILADFLTAADRAAADPHGAVQALGNLLLETFRDTPEAGALLVRLDREPNNPSVQTAIRGRISEGLLNHPQFASQLDAALARFTPVAPDQATWQPSVQQTHSAGNMATVSATTGSVNIKQRAIKIGRLQIPVPIFALLLLLGGGAVIGGGVTIINSGSDRTTAVNPESINAREYGYYMTGIHMLTYIHWTTQKDGSVSGEINIYNPASTDPIRLTGRQDGNKVSLKVEPPFFGKSEIQGTIHQDALTFEEGGTIEAITPGKFGQILSDFRRQNP